MAKLPKEPKPGHNPFRGFVDLMSEMNRAQSQWMLRGKAGENTQATSAAAAYVPPTDIFAIGKDLVVRCEVPGVRKDEVSVSVSNGMLTISGYRDSELDESKVVYYTRERVYGAFRRSMLLPEGVEDSAVDAAFRNGLLEITVHGGAATKPKQINISGDDDD